MLFVFYSPTIACQFAGFANNSVAWNNYANWVCTNCLGRHFLFSHLPCKRASNVAIARRFAKGNVFKKMPNLFLKWHSLFKSIFHIKIRLFARKINIKPFSRFSANVCVLPVALKYATNFFIFLSSVKIFITIFYAKKNECKRIFSIFPFNNIDKKLIF